MTMFSVRNFRVYPAILTVAAVLSVQGCSVGDEDWQSSQGPKRLMVKTTVVDGQATHVVMSPGCPDWSDQANWTTENRVSSNFGCSTANNLGQMLADPGDYVQGRQNGLVDGQYAASGVRRYHEDKTKPLHTESTSGRQSSGGQK